MIWRHNYKQNKVFKQLLQLYWVYILFQARRADISKHICFYTQQRDLIKRILEWDTKDDPFDSERLYYWHWNWNWRNQWTLFRLSAKYYSIIEKKCEKDTEYERNCSTEIIKIETKNFCKVSTCYEENWISTTYREVVQKSKQMKLRSGTNGIDQHMKWNWTEVLIALNSLRNDTEQRY